MNKPGLYTVILPTSLEEINFYYQSANGFIVYPNLSNLPNLRSIRIQASGLNFDGYKKIFSELSGNEIKHLISKNNTEDIDLELIVNGNLEVIVSKDDFSNLNDGKDFIIHNNADYAILEDKKRKKFKYKVLFDYNKQSHIINKDCLCLIEEMNEIKHLGLDSIILDCRYSNEKYTTNILSIYNDSLKDRDDEELSKYKYQIMDFSQSYINKGNYIEGRLHEDKHENS